MSAPTKRAAAKKAAVKRSPRAAAAKAPDVEPALSDEDLDALTDDVDAPLAPGEIRPVIIGKRGRRGDAPVQMVTLFELDGVQHQMPRNPSAALVLQWILDVQAMGERTAAFNMGVTLLGQQALDNLKSSPEVEVEDIADIFTNIGIVFFTSENYRKVMAAPDPS